MSVSRRSASRWRRTTCSASRRPSAVNRTVRSISTKPAPSMRRIISDTAGRETPRRSAMRAWMTSTSSSCSSNTASQYSSKAGCHSGEWYSGTSVSLRARFRLPPLAAGYPRAMAAPTIVASFDRPDQARDAVIALEKRGVDANDIVVDEGDVPVPVGAGTREVDLETTNRPLRRYGAGGTIGAVVLAGLAVVAVLVAGADPLPLAVGIAAVCGAIVGFVMGGLFTVNASQPVTTEAYDMSASDAAGAPGPVRVEVHVTHATHGPDPDAVEAALRSLHPRSVHREGRRPTHGVTLRVSCRLALQLFGVCTSSPAAPTAGPFARPAPVVAHHAQGV